MKAQLFAIGLGIALLLPLAVYTGVNIADPPPEWDKYDYTEFQQRRSEAKSKEEKERIREEEQRLKKKLEAEEAQHQKLVFYVSFPVGMLAVIAGTLVAARVIGAGLMFGGIFLLAGGCYSYWDKMTALVRFGSVLLALTVFIMLGYWMARERRNSAVEESP